MWAIYNPETGFADFLVGSRREARELSFPQDREKVFEVALINEKGDADFLPVIGWAVISESDNFLLKGRHEARVLARETGSTVYKVVLA